MKATDPLVQCQHCWETLRWSKADESYKRVSRETHEHPAEYILICPFCGHEEPSYELVDTPTAAARMPGDKDPAPSEGLQPSGRSERSLR